MSCCFSLDRFKWCERYGIVLADKNILTISYDLFTKNRLVQEFGSNPTLLKAWNDKVLNLFAFKNENDPTTLEKIADDNLLVHFKRGLYKLTK